MDVIKSQLLKIQEQLNGLSASQKMLTASLVAIMVMTVLWWARYTGNSDFEPVLDQSLSATDIGQIKTTLDSHGIEARINADRVLVPSARKMEAVAMLAYADALPSNSSNAWDEMVKQQSPWDSQSKNDSMRNHMLERTLSTTITGFFPGVSKANVLINPLSERRIGESLEPSASVQITTKSGRDVNIKQLAEATANTVASAVPGLSKDRVKIIVDGITRRTQSNADSGYASDLFEQIANQEKVTDEKISGMLMPGALVAVSLDVQTQSSEETSETFDPAHTIVKPRISETNTEETSTPIPQSTEPGALPNTGLSVTSASAAPAATSTIEKSHEENSIFVDRKVQHTLKPSGTPTVLSAAVRVPRSYLISKYKSLHPTDKEPDEAALAPLVAAELPAIQKIVNGCVKVPSLEAITVDMYFDTTTPILAIADNASNSSAMMSMVGSHVKEIAVGALALVSLFMVSTMVKKASPQPILAMGAAEAGEAGRLSPEAFAAIVGQSGATLDGIELDEDSVRAQQMVEQVQTMVKEDPDAAASLVKRWLSRT